MEFLKDRRTVIAAGIGLALFIGLVIVLTLAKTKKSDEPPPASQAGLVIEQGRPDDAKLDPKRELGCFVGGQYVGLATWADCAKRNGVATGDLDVGIDEQGGLAAAAPNAGAVLTPLPPTQATTSAMPSPTAPMTPPPAPVAAAATPRGPTAACWRYADRTWYRMAEMSQGACVQTLFAGKCEKAGSATYGRWGDQTLRLVPGKVEASDDNRSFRLVGEQASNCSIPAL
jgi:hypothetical protein